MRRHARPDRCDVRPFQSRRAAALCRNFNLDENFHAAYTVGDDIVLVSDLPRSRRDVRALGPAVVVVDIGPNDIARLTAVDHGAMLRLAMDVHKFAMSLDVAMVVLNAVLPRTDRLTCSPDIFLTNAKSNNKILCNLAGSEGSPCVVFNQMRGFFGQSSGSGELPVSSWSSDGIHPNREDSMRRYRNRIRQCILENLHRIVTL